VSIVDGQPLHVEAKRGEPLGIGFRIDYHLATGQTRIDSQYS
jgi:hypothetical protein